MSRVEWNTDAMRSVYAILDKKLSKISNRIAYYASYYTRPINAPPRPPGRPATGRTGMLSSSYYVTSMGAPLHYRVVTHSRHALWTELGTGIWHTVPMGSDDFRLSASPNPRITPKRARFLRVRFWDGTVQFREFVLGQKPRPTLRAAAQKVKRQIRRILESRETVSLPS